MNTSPEDNFEAYQKMSEENLATNELDQRILKKFHTIREKLHYNGLKELSLEFPIISGPTLKVGGVTWVKTDKWKPITRGGKMLMKSTQYTIEGVAICLRNEEGQVNAIEDLVMVLLHEFAHTISPCYSLLNEFTGEKLPKKKEKRLNHELAHSPEFWENYAYLLQLAEKLKIFYIPDIPGERNKFNVSHLQAIDEGKKSYGKLSLSELGFHIFHDIKEEDPSQFISKEEKITQLLITFSFKGQKKLATVQSSETSDDDLFKLSRRKFPKGKFSKLQTKEGKPFSIQNCSNSTNLEIYLCQKTHS